MTFYQLLKYNLTFDIANVLIFKIVLPDFILVTNVMSCTYFNQIAFFCLNEIVKFLFYFQDFRGKLMARSSTV